MLSRKRLGVLVLAALLAVQVTHAQMPDPNDPNTVDPNAVDPNAVVLPPLPLGDALEAISEGLLADQIVNNNAPGTGWPGMENYNGAITQGMVSAFNIFGDDAYAYSARRGCGWLYLDSLWQTPLGDSVQAWAAFGATGTFNTAVWSDTALSFFENIQAYTPGAAAAYAASLSGGDTSSSVYYLANLTLAAYLVDAPAKAVWRQALADELATVTDDNSIFPVQAIGVGTWALATTGSLGGDTTLPDLLVSHQSPADGYDPGSFFWRLDHSIDDPNIVAEGYTQDAIFSVLGLYAAAADNPAIVPALQAPIVNGVKAILGSLGEDGMVYEHLSLGGQASYVYAAQVLLLADIMGLDLTVDLNALDQVSTYEDLGIVLASPMIWNPSFELPGTVNQTNFDNVVGWASAEGDVDDSGVEEGWGATDGTWTAFLKASDPGVFQVTQHTVAADDIIQLSVDAKNLWAATTLLMQLFYVDGTGAQVPVATADIALTDEMVTSSLIFVGADDPNAVGQRLGILFDNVTADGASWLGLDSVAIDFLAEVPDPNAG